MATAIVTKYLGPTNTRGARIVATSVGGRRVTIGYPHHLNGEACYREALAAWLEKHGSLRGVSALKWAGGETKGGYAFCPIFGDE